MHSWAFKYTIPHPEPVKKTITPSSAAVHPAIEMTATKDTRSITVISIRALVMIGILSSIEPMSVVHRDIIRARGTVSNHLKNEFKNQVEYKNAAAEIYGP